MQKFKVVAEAGLTTPDEVAHAVNDVVELDETLQTTMDYQAQGIIVLVPDSETIPSTPAGPADSTPVPAPTVSFDLSVVYDPNAPQADIAAAQSFIADLSNEINGEAAVVVPGVITSITISRATPTPSV